MAQSHYTERLIVYTVRLDENINGYTYIGKAMPGAVEADSVWQIMRMDAASTSFIFANGSDDFNQVWNDRTTLSYS